MKKLAARIALVVAIFAAPSLVLADAAPVKPDAKKDAKKDTKKDAKKDAPKTEKKDASGGGW